MSEPTKTYPKNNGGLWEEKNRNGDIFFSGNIELNGEKIRFRAFPNRLKQVGEKTPDFRIFINTDKAVDTKQSYTSKIVKKTIKKSEPVSSEDSPEL